MKDLIQKKLDRYQAKSVQEEENALKEITQEVALYALAKSGFFEKAAFLGGTCLRIIYGLDRFSEDLDFSLQKPDLNFDLQPYLIHTADLMKAFGFELEISGVDRAEKSVRQRFLKDESVKKIFTFKHISDFKKKINIKVEIDVNPPDHAVTEPRYVDFPNEFSLAAHNLPSLFAGKTHALLCRPHVKGRDWYDFGWYVAQQTPIHLPLLQAALHQHGQWKDENRSIDTAWLKGELLRKINSIDWKKAVLDISPFLQPARRQEVEELWSQDFFHAKVRRMNGL